MMRISPAPPPPTSSTRRSRGERRRSWMCYVRDVDNGFGWRDHQLTCAVWRRKQRVFANAHPAHPRSEVSLPLPWSGSPST